MFGDPSVSFPLFASDVETGRQNYSRRPCAITIAMSIGCKTVSQMQCEGSFSKGDIRSL